MYPDEDPKVLIETMNLVPDSNEYDLKLYENSKLIHDSYWSGSPLNEDRFKKQVYCKDKKDEDGDPGVYIYLDFRLSEADIKVEKDRISMVYKDYLLEFKKISITKFVL